MRILLGGPRLMGMFLGLLWGSLGMSPAVADTTLCPPTALSRFRTHTVMAGETVVAIARQYNLMPTTLTLINGDLSGGLQPGQTLRIPPFNGRVVEPAANQTWQQIADTYNSRADVLFELNGCQATVPDRVFVPGVFGPPTGSAARTDAHPLRTVPLEPPAAVRAAYGWQPDPTRQELVFNTGVILSATAASPVRAAGAGTVAFAGTDEVYGNLVVINHQQGLQTRYANLAALDVQAGDVVQAGATLGTLSPDAQQARLYFEVRLNSPEGWVAQDPQQYLPALGLR